MPVIRISNELYKRLESQAQGFDTPASVIERLLDASENKPFSAARVESNDMDRPELVFVPD